jgi:xanthine dehydrogenase YagS FAD-binding subunit
MAGIRDMMGAFELFQPTELDGALDLLRRHRGNAWVLSGGMDTFDWLKDRAKRPPVVVDLGRIPALKGIESTAEGLRIGAMTSLTEVATHPEIVSGYGLLAQAAEQVATPQIRHQGTLGGNLCQDTRCWYYRSGWPCYRAGGNVCYANAPNAMNREHCVFEADRCVAVSPSDTAPALVARLADPDLVPGRQALDVGRKDVARADRHAHAQDRLGEQLVGRGRAGAVDVGELDHEIVDRLQRCVGRGHAASLARRLRHPGPA